MEMKCANVSLAHQYTATYESIVSKNKLVTVDDESDIIMKKLGKPITDFF